MTGSRPRRIAVLGGGIASLAAAYELTSRPGSAERYEITVYQLGFRLGGKGASGCNRAASDRIEEHGLHVWMGFYENAFQLIRRCYGELGRRPDEPLATWRDAFKPHDFVTWEEEVGGRYRHWFAPFPRNDGEPGGGFPSPTPWDHVRELVPGMLRGWYHMKESPSLGAHLRGVALGSAIVALQVAYRAATLPGSSIEAGGSALLAPLTALRARVQEAVERRVEEDDDARRLWICFDLIHAFTTGLIVDRVVTLGFDAIDDDDLRAWLRRHGASDLTLRSALVRSMYDFVFAYADGDMERPAIGAGTMARVVLRMLFAHPGAIFYKMQAGMGETVFAPLYEVLRRRGVRFEFFHRADRLELSSDGSLVDTIRMGVQAKVRSGPYRPLIEVGGLPCWPTEPLYDQLVEGAALETGRIDLESRWTPWPDSGSRVLRRGEDFDDVVLGIPLGALRPLCDELIAARPAWRAMVEHVKTVQTQAMQLWLTRDLVELGWTRPSPLLTGYAYPHSTWADFSHLLPREGWSSARAELPRSLAYFCGPMVERTRPPGEEEHDFPERARRAAQESGRRWIQHHLARLWPEAGGMRPGEAFDWGLLVDPSGAEGPQRLEAQYVRANVNPWDRYVLSVPGSTRHRLRSDESGIDNLWLAGDWVRTGLNLGCIEGAVMAGRQASRAISGHPASIPGESDLGE
jgi:uncharacterized protein with NAD-binding domain and iron-sulfur cluster